MKFTIKYDENKAEYTLADCPDGIWKLVGGEAYYIVKGENYSCLDFVLAGIGSFMNRRSYTSTYVVPFKGTIEFH